MALCWPSLILLIFAFFSYVDANFTLTDELTNFIPACAQECFISFLDTNFGTSGCSNAPSLDCLCSHNTTTGYTVGEGGVQCILGEANTGFCKGDDAGETVIIGAFQMCSGRASALPNTHGTITATLIVESSMPSIVVVAPATVTATPPDMTTLTTVPTTGLTAAPSSTASVSASASATAIPAVVGTQGTKLTQNQIIGIGAGIAGAGIICVSAIMLILFLQKRKTRKLLAARESDLIPFQMDPEFYGSNGGANGGVNGGTASSQGSAEGEKLARFRGRKGEITPPVPPIPPRLEISNPNMFSRRSIMQETIGLAISPDQSVAADKTPRRSSRLLPEKPVLKLTMPPPKKKVEQQGTRFSQNLKQNSAVSRQSNATQFELDDDSADTAVSSANAWSRRSTERILNNKNWQTEFPINPEPAPPAITVMRPGEFRWRPPNTSPTKDGPASTINRNIGSFSQPRRPDEYTRPQQQKQQLQPAISDQTRAPSSVYSGRGSVSASDGGRDSAPRAINSYGQVGPYDYQQAAPSKTPNSAHPEDIRYGELSPVAESPASGRSPVSYPKIPKRLSTAQMMLPPPPQPDFTKALGAGGMKPWRQAELVSQRDRERHAYEQPQETPSEIQIGMLSPRQGLGHQKKVISIEDNNPGTRTFNFPAPPPERSQDLRPPPLALLPGSQKASPSPRQSPTPPPALLSDRKPFTNSIGGSSHGSLIPFALSTTPRAPDFKPLQRSTSTTSRPGPGINPLSSHPSISFTRPPSLISQSSKMSSNSTASSLLAKRRGEKQAKELMLANEEDKRRQQAKWRVLKREEIEMAKKEGWRPRLGNEAVGRGSGSGSAGDNIRGVVKEYEFERTELPRTPGWVPKLTPTRRGDELFLSVQ